ncbi:MAG: hypothetical protein KIT00_04340 [Rhodospirillales bacterium]|nr:hypothetical protein [Rhodospirillales bacterium]
MAACDGGSEVAEVPFSKVREALDGEVQAQQAYFDTIKGKTVRWSGHIVRADRVHGDDYVEEGHLLVDMDEAGQGSPAADVTFEIPVSKIDPLNKPGEPVTFVATILALTTSNDGPLIQMNLKELVE